MKVLVKVYNRPGSVQLKDDTSVIENIIFPTGTSKKTYTAHTKNNKGYVTVSSTAEDIAAITVTGKDSTDNDTELSGYTASNNKIPVTVTRGSTNGASKLTVRELDTYYDLTSKSAIANGLVQGMVVSDDTDVYGTISSEHSYIFRPDKYAEGETYITFGTGTVSEPTSVMNMTEMGLTVGKGTGSLTATAAGYKEGALSYGWTSSDTEIATITPVMTGAAAQTSNNGNTITSSYGGGTLTITKNGSGLSSVYTNTTGSGGDTVFINPVAKGTCTIYCTVTDGTSSKTVSCTVTVGLDISTCTIIVQDSKYYYTGGPIYPERVIVESGNVILTNGVDYTLTYPGNITGSPTENTEVTITILGLKDYQGSSAIAKYTIVATHPSSSGTGSDSQGSDTNSGTDSNTSGDSNSGLNGGGTTDTPDEGGNTQSGDQTISDLPVNSGGDSSSSSSASGGAFSLRKGFTFDFGTGAKAASYRVTDADSRTLSYIAYKGTGKSVTLPASLSIGGKSFKVTSVEASAFAGTKAKTVTIGKYVKTLSKGAFTDSKVTKVIVKTKKLTAASTKGCFKDSKVKTVKVSFTKSSAIKKYKKKYKTIFRKSNSGKSVKVK